MIDFSKYKTTKDYDQVLLDKRTPSAVAEAHCIWWAFKVLDNDGKQEC